LYPKEHGNPGKFSFRSEKERETQGTACWLEGAECEMAKMECRVDGKKVPNGIGIFLWNDREDSRENRTNKSDVKERREGQSLLGGKMETPSARGEPAGGGKGVVGGICAKLKEPPWGKDNPGQVGEVGLKSFKKENKYVEGGVEADWGQ